MLNRSSDDILNDTLHDNNDSDASDDILDDKLHEFVNACASYLNYTFTEYNSEDTVLLFSTISSVVLVLSVTFNFIGVIIGSVHMGKTSFGVYLNIALGNGVVLTMVSFVVTCSILQDDERGIFHTFPKDQFCLQARFGYLLFDILHVSSLVMLCANRIMGQRGAEKEHIEYSECLRWPVMATGLSVTVGLFLTNYYAKYRSLALDFKKAKYGNYTAQNCVTGFMVPFCEDLKADRFFSSIPIVLDAFLALCLVLLVVEILLKKRRWKRHVKNWDTKRNSLDISIDDLGIDDVRAQIRQMRRGGRSTVTSTSTGRRMTLCAKSTRGLLQPENTYPASSTNTKSLDVIPFLEFYQQESLPTSNPASHKTSMTLAMIAALLVFRIPRDMMIALPVKQHFKLSSLDLHTQLAMVLVHEVGLILPVPIFCTIGSSYASAIVEWLFEYPLSCTDADRLTPEKAAALMDKFHHKPQQAYIEEWGDPNNGVIRIEDILSNTVSVIAHQTHILDILANSRMPAEPAFLEELKPSSLFDDNAKASVEDIDEDDDDNDDDDDDDVSRDVSSESIDSEFRKEFSERFSLSSIVKTESPLSPSDSGGGSGHVDPENRESRMVSPGSRSMMSLTSASLGIAVPSPTAVDKTSPSLSKF